MGGRIVLPEPDANIQKCIKNYFLTPKEISDFWKIFQKLDKGKTGFVKLDAIYKRIHWTRSLITDCILEILDIEHEGEINFSEFLIMITTYCFFEPPEILKFMFYVFDQDKAGFLETDDLHALVETIHGINAAKGDVFRGTIKESWTRVEKEASKLDFDELRRVQEKFPKLFAPAFRLQQEMMNGYMGETWWDLKKRRVQNKKDAADEIIRKKQKKKEDKIKKKKAIKIMRNMGIVKYYFCFCYRDLYDPARTEYDGLTAEQKAAKDREFALKKRQMELQLKNPETTPWNKYQQKAIPEKGGSTEFLEKRIAETERPREERAMSREQRRQQRQKDPDLKIKTRMTASGVDI